MSKKQPIKIEVKKNIEVSPEGIYKSEVVKGGNGAVIKSFKRFIGKKVLIILIENIKEN
tara:strand:- start:9352 stop:9528 length:177 start_codon:yes stop_codon:yes gene_type:complete